MRRKEVQINKYVIISGIASNTYCLLRHSWYFFTKNSSISKRAVFFTHFSNIFFFLRLFFILTKQLTLKYFWSNVDDVICGWHSFTSYSLDTNKILNVLRDILNYYFVFEQMLYFRVSSVEASSHLHALFFSSHSLKLNIGFPFLLIPHLFSFFFFLWKIHFLFNSKIKSHNNARRCFQVWPFFCSIVLYLNSCLLPNIQFTEHTQWIFIELWKWWNFDKQQHQPSTE